MDLSRFTEGDYIRTVDGLFFAVKGGRHSDELAVATLRYIPDLKGERVLHGVRYRRVYDIDSTTKYLETNFPSYINHIEWLGFRLQSVPPSRILEVYKPTKRLQAILDNPKTRLETRIAKFVKALSAASSVSTSFFGVSGSVLIGLDNEDSDIDLNVYGALEGEKVYEALRRLRSEQEWIRPYDLVTIEPVYSSRWGGVDLGDLRLIECGKLLHGLVYGVDYFIRLLIDEDESESTPVCTISISATVVDASQSIYSPCTYRVTDVKTENSSSQYKILELKSYRGKFTEHAQTGDRIRARGTLEKVTREGYTFYRLILGGKGDFLVRV